MSRKFWIIAIAAVLVLALLAGGAVAGLLIYRHVRNQRWLASATEAYAEGDWPVARGFLQRYLPQDPENIELLLMYADVNRKILTRRRGSLGNVEQAFHQILNAYPDRAEYRTELVALYMDMHNWAALEYYTLEWLNDTPGDDELRYHHALALERQGRREDAIAAYRELLDAGTSHTEAWGNLARLLQEVGRDETGLSTLDEGLEKNPDNGLLHMHRGLFLARQENWDAAKGELEKARRLAPDDVDVLLTSGHFAALHRKWDDAIAFGDRALEQGPERADVVAAVAVLYTNSGQPEKGVDLLGAQDEETLVDHPDLLVTLADTLVSLGRQDEAEPYVKLYTDAYPEQRSIADYFEARRLLADGEAAAAEERLGMVTETLPSFSPAQFALGVAYLEAGKEDLARDALEAYLRNKPNDMRAQALYREHFGVQQSVEELRARAVDMLARGGMNAELLLSMAMALFEAGSAQGGADPPMGLIRQLVDRAVEETPDYAPAYRFLGDVMVRAGDAEGGRDALRRAAEASVPAEELAMTRAGVAVLDGKPGEVVTLFQGRQQSGDNSAETASRWAGYLESLGRRDLALEILELGLAAAATEEDRSALQVSRITISARGNDVARAREMLAEAAPDFAPERPGWLDFNEAKLDVARALVRLESEESMHAAEKLVAEVREAGIESADRSAVEGMLALQRDPPDLDAAWESFQDALRAEPSHINALAGLARVAAGRGSFSQALEFSERTVARAPQSMATRRQLADLQVRLGRHQEAVRTLRPVLQEEPNDPATLDLLIRALLGAGQPRAAAEAMTRLEAAVGSNPAGLERVAALRGRVLHATGDSGGAEAALREQLAARPGDLATLRDLARAVRGQGRFEEAEGLLREHVLQDEKNPEAWTTLAEFYLGEPGTELLEKCSSALTRALLLEPDNVPALRGMLLLQLRQGRYAEAVGMCDRILALEPKDSEVLFRKAVLLAREDRSLPEALDCIDAALSVEERTSYLAVRGIILSRLAQYDEALSVLRTVSKSVAKTSAQVDLAVAASYAGIGEAELAREYFESAVDRAQKGDWLREDRLAAVREQLEALEKEELEKEQSEEEELEEPESEP